MSAQHGLAIGILPGQPFHQYLKTVQQIGVFLHDERADVYLDGVLSLNGIWIKEIEVAARGCFALRNMDEDFGSYGFEQISTVFAYRDETEVPEILERIQAMPEIEKDERRAATVDAIRQRNDWNIIGDVILGKA